MKTLVEFMDENIENVNESLTSVSIAAAMFFFTLLINISKVINNSTGDLDTRSQWQIIKDDIRGFFKDKKLKKIAEKYKDDPEIIEYLENPKKAGWRKMLATKLEPEEIQYINSLTRNYFK